MDGERYPKMTLVEPAETFEFDYWRSVVDELSLEDEFEAVTGTPFNEDYTIEISEGILIEELLEAAEQRFILNVVHHNPNPYTILLLDDD
ncbi:hypothetical protein BN903_305 [Halorubrum sp. AJ67]|nr:hypothetical protein BN903_305 [Halorubrum sp. AJ67]